MLNSDKIKKIIKLRKGREMLKPNDFSGAWLIEFPSTEHARKAMVTLNKVLGYKAESYKGDSKIVAISNTIR